MMARPGQAPLLFAVTATVVCFFGFLRLCANQSQPIREWAWLRFLPQYNQEHSKLIALLVLFLPWYHRTELRAAKKEGSNLGLLFVGLEPRIVQCLRKIETAMGEPGLAAASASGGTRFRAV
jgi:hypothetical protein